METTDSTQSSISEPSSTLFSHAIKWGIILGVIAVVITLLLYIVDYSYLADWKVGIFTLLLFLGCVIYAGINYRSQVGGYLPYGKAFQHGFVLLATAGLIHIVFAIILHNVIDPELPQKITDATIEKTSEMLAGFGMQEDKIEEQLDKMREDMPERFTPGGQLISYLWALILYAVVSAVSSLFVKKNTPETF
jgi:hypothetical protein